MSEGVRGEEWGSYEGRVYHTVSIMLHPPCTPPPPPPPPPPPHTHTHVQLTCGERIVQVWFVVFSSHDWVPVLEKLIKYFRLFVPKNRCTWDCYRRRQWSTIQLHPHTLDFTLPLHDYSSFHSSYSSSIVATLPLQKLITSSSCAYTFFTQTLTIMYFASLLWLANKETSI